MLLIPLLMVVAANPPGDYRSEDRHARGCNADLLHVLQTWHEALYSYHPPLQTIAVLMFVQGVVTLQPTSTKHEKARCLTLHALFQIAGLALSECASRKKRRRALLK